MEMSIKRTLLVAIYYNEYIWHSTHRFAALYIYGRLRMAEIVMFLCML